MAKNILISDDAAFMRMMIKDILTKNGYNVVGEAENGKVAVDKYHAGDGWYRILKGNPCKGSKCLRYHVFCNGSAGNGYRGNSVRCQGLYRKAVPGRACARGSKKSSRLI